ncbi:MAG TPA: DUF6232 family protein [Cyclobacteriaceae bacterium]
MAAKLRSAQQQIAMTMATEEIFYTDGQDVVVTLSTLQVKDRFYRLNAIKQHGVTILEPVRLPGLIIFIAGVVLSIMGLAGAFVETVPASLSPTGSPMSFNSVAMWLGVLLAMGGLMLTVALGERYAVKLDTPDGEKLAIVSTKREQILEIASALNRAFMMIDVERSIAQSRFK